MSLWTVPHVKRRCSSCGQAFRAVAWCEYVGDIFLGVAWSLPIVLAIFGKLPWLAAIALAVAVLALGLWAWPYVTLFEKVTPSP
jgi:hypothetical protein